MTRRLLRRRWGLRAGLLLAVALGAAAWAQESLIDAPEPYHVAKKGRVLPDHLPDKPSQPPAFSINVEQLGFSAPGAIFLGQNNSLVSLDFLDENRLLFTFRVPGLVHRTADADEQRQIRAVVLALPAGTVESEALWTVHDRARYLWMLSGGRFLLRDRDNLESGDATLELKPYLHFAGPLLWLEMDPKQEFLVTNSREPAATKKPVAAASEADLSVRILRRDSGQVMLVSRAASAVHLPINAEGYLESLRSSDEEWLLNLKFFSGGSRILGHVTSSCAPEFDFLTEQEILVSSCTELGAGKLLVMRTDGRRLWEAQTSDTTLWPLVVRAPDGTRLAREALAVAHPVKSHSIHQDEITGQLIEVLDAADGKVVLEASANPALDAGGNLAISPSGRRVAIVNNGAIQVFELPPPTVLPDSAAQPSHH